MVGHVAKKRPSHDLEQIAVEWWRETIGRRAGACATWMYVIEIGALSHDLDELLVGMASCRQPRFVRCQIARVKVRNLRRCAKWAKIPPSAQIVRRIYFCLAAKRRGQLIGVAADCKFCWRACRVTAVAVADSVDNIAAQTYQGPVLALQVQGHRGDVEAASNPGFLSLVRRVLVTRSDALRAIRHSRENNSSEYRDDSRGL
jgi:hypothetical protein